MLRYLVAVIAFVAATEAAAAQKEIRAMCTTSMDGGPRIVTNLAPISVPTNISSPREMKAKLNYLASETMRALGMTYNQTASCAFVDPSMPLQDGNQTEATIIDFQRAVISGGYKVVDVARLDLGAAAKASAGTPPPSEHADGRPLRFFYTVGMNPTPGETRNPMCVSTVVTLTEKVDWKEWSSSSRAESLAAPFASSFMQRCRRLGAVTAGARGYAIFDRGDGQFKPTPHPTDRKVTLP